MQVSRATRIVVIVSLLFLALLLYAELESIHQIHPITESRISRASDEQGRQDLIQARDKRNNEERLERLKVEVALAIDLLLIAYVTWTMVKRSRPQMSPGGLIR
jgi:hypothetical protein